MHSIRHSIDLPGIVVKGKEIRIYHAFCITNVDAITINLRALVSGLITVVAI
jgi:hypothetical protein